MIMTTELDNPLFFYMKKLTNLQPMVPLLEAVAQAGRPLMIISKEAEGEALATLVVNKLRGGLKVVAVKALDLVIEEKLCLKILLF